MSIYVTHSIPSQFFHCFILNMPLKCVYLILFVIFLIVTLWIRFSNHSHKFMDAYMKGLNSWQAAWAARKYKGHRVLPESLMDDLEKANIVKFILTIFRHNLTGSNTCYLLYVSMYFGIFFTKSLYFALKFCKYIPNTISNKSMGPDFWFPLFPLLSSKFCLENVN